MIETFAILVVVVAAVWFTYHLVTRYHVADKRSAVVGWQLAEHKKLLSKAELRSEMQQRTIKLSERARLTEKERFHELTQQFALAGCAEAEDILAEFAAEGWNATFAPDDLPLGDGVLQPEFEEPDTAPE